MISAQIGSRVGKICLKIVSFLVEDGSQGMGIYKKHLRELDVNSKVSFKVNCC